MFAYANVFVFVSMFVSMCVRVSVCVNVCVYMCVCAGVCVSDSVVLFMHASIILTCYYMTKTVDFKNVAS